MNEKIVGILICMLLITTTITTVAVNINNDLFNKAKVVKPVDVPDRYLKGADQYQIENMNYGMVVSPVYHVAQEFKPTKNDLTAVALYFFDINAPTDVEITVCIRETLNGSNLASKIINTDDIKISDTGTWVMFDFDDVTIAPEEIYYIVCYASDGVVNNCYCWFFDSGNKYDRGIAWQSMDSGETWSDLENEGGNPEFNQLDLCFITYSEEPPRNLILSNVNHIIMRLFERYQNLFPILRLLFGI
jgi:hypothetical protein